MMVMIMMMMMMIIIIIIIHKYKKATQISETGISSREAVAPEQD